MAGCAASSGAINAIGLPGARLPADEARSPIGGDADATQVAREFLAPLTQGSLANIQTLRALNRVVANLGVIGRNLHQMARATQQAAPAAEIRRIDVMAMIRVCEALRDHVKALRADNSDRRMLVLKEITAICGDSNSLVIYFGPTVQDAECMAFLLR